MDKVSTSAIIVLSACLIVTGGMVLDPIAGFICFVLSGVPALLTAVRGKGRIRYVSMIVLVVGLALAFSKAPDALKHYETYLKKSTASVR